MRGARLLARGRALAESRMTDTCRIRASEGGDRYDEATKTWVTVEPVYSYVGPCLVKFGATQPRQVDLVGQVVTEQQIELHLPVATSADVEPDHVAEILTAASDPDLVGCEFRVMGRFHQTFATARRLPVEEASGG